MKLFKITWHKKVCPLFRIVFFLCFENTQTSSRCKDSARTNLPHADGTCPKRRGTKNKNTRPGSQQTSCWSCPWKAHTLGSRQCAWSKREREGGREILPYFPTRAVQRDIRKLTVGRMLLFSRDGASWRVTNMDAQRDTPWTGGEGPKFSDEKCCTSVWALFVLVALFFDLVRANHKCFRESCRK